MPESDTDTISLDLPTTVQRLGAIATELESLGQRDELSEADNTRWRDLTTEFERLDDHRSHLVREADLRRVRSAMANGATLENGSGPDGDRDSDPLGEPDSIERFRDGRADPFDLTNVRTFGRSQNEVTAEFRARAFSAIERMRGMSDQHREAATQIIERFEDDRGTISRLALTTGHPDYLSAWTRMMRSAGNARLNDRQSAAWERMEDLQRAMSLTDAEGGYLVPFQIDPTVIITADGSRNDIRRIARQVVATGDKWHGVSSGAVSWSYDVEATSVSDDSTTFAQPSVEIHMARGFVPISIQALQDEANVTTEVGRLLAFGRDVLEATKFVLGSGSGEPYGIVTVLAATDGGSPDRTVDVTTANVLADEDIYALHDAVPARYRAGSSWLANNSIYSLVRQFGATGGSDMWERIGAERPPLLVGRPAYEAEAMDGVITSLATDFIAVFGDFDNYVIADRIGFQVELVPHLFQQATAGTGFGMPTGQRGWFAYVRNGANCVNTGAFRVLNAPG